MQEKIFTNWLFYFWFCLGLKLGRIGISNANNPEKLAVKLPKITLFKHFCSIMLTMDIERIFRANPWWDENWDFSNDPHISSLKRMKYVWNVKLPSIEKEGIYMIRGPRQIGKTTWIKNKIKELSRRHRRSVFYYSCEMLSKEQFDELFYTLEEINFPLKYLFLDEVGYIKDWQLVVKHHWDRGFLRGKRVILTGSTSLDLKRGYERMPGRKGKGKEIFFYPASFYDFVVIVKGREVLPSYFLSHLEEMNHLLSLYLLSGGFPLAFNDLLSKGKIEDTTYEVYIDWIRGDAERANLPTEKLIALSKVFINALSNPLSWQEIARRIGVSSHHTSNEYAEKIERLFLIFHIYNAFPTHEVQQKKNKKFYFIDPFVFWSFYGIAYGKEALYEKAKLLLDSWFHRLVENALFSHFLRFFSQDYYHHIFYYKTKKGEVDFYIKLKGKAYLFESKFAEKVFPKRKDVVYITRKDVGRRMLPASYFLYLLGRIGSKTANNPEKLAVKLPKILKNPFNQ